ncbi:hypothetical protein MXD63_27860 [Frankia sp. Cpl3]|uniref:hypothetical protein n=1 Tax=Parafrankia colletiae TaxID=573497 RepID=UPI000AB18C3D|nr:hypothetical protein [Parafrankia colletiae]MCK9903854.1 hypothetical protein [Frankia sp. Cpl3]
MTATAIASAKAVRKPRRRVTRQLLLTAHVLVSVGWNGVALGQLALAVTAALESEIRHPAYELMHVFDRALNIPLALLTLATGVLISVRTPWGLLRHWWVVAKLAITVIAVIFAAAFMRTLIVRAGHATADGEVHYGAPAAAIITGACLMNALFITATFLSTLKPWGRTRRGLRAVRTPSTSSRPAAGARGPARPATVDDTRGGGDPAAATTRNAQSSPEAPAATDQAATDQAAEIARLP